MEYVSKTLLLNQLAALSTLLAGTYTICAYFMRRRQPTGRLPSPLKNPVMLAAMILAVVLAWFFVDGDLVCGDNNQQALLKKYGITTESTILSVTETWPGRHLNSRYRWAEITCEFGDRDGRVWTVTTVEGYNVIYTKVAPWQPGQPWSSGSKPQIIYMAENPRVFRIAAAVRSNEKCPASRSEFLLALFWIWWFPVAWVSVLLWVLLKSGRKARAMMIKAGVSEWPSLCARHTDGARSSRDERNKSVIYQCTNG
jgi:hypothetical protein